MTYEPSNADQRGGINSNGKPSLTVADAAAQLVREGVSWSAALGTGAIVTYAFRDSAPPNMPQQTSGFTPFSATQITSTERALAAWASVADITFVRVNPTGYSSDATILFGNYSSGPEQTAAFAFMPGDPSPRSPSGDVWINSSYPPNTHGQGEGFEVLLHEIGHAIGLAHPGDYDSEGEASYAATALYAEDSRQYSIMSYFDATETGASPPPYSTFPTTPLIDDIAAAQLLYGRNPAGHGSNTAWGIGPYFGAVGEVVGLPRWGTIYDGGGIDEIAFGPTVGGPQRLDLRPGSFSNPGGTVGLLSIAVGTVIENGRVSEWDSVLIGNDAANILWGTVGSTYTGGAGDDVFMSSDTGWSRATITDFSPGDRIVVLDVSAIGFSASLTGEQLTFRGGSATLSNRPDGQIVVEAYQSGISIRLAPGSPNPATTFQPTVNDFTADGRSDILWRHDDGSVATWDGGLRFQTYGPTIPVVPADWRIVATGDYNGDGLADILWRNRDGTVSNWLMDQVATRSFQANDANALTRVSTDWRIAGSGDFDGNGRADILWRHESGLLSDWLSTPSGGFTPNDARALTRVDPSWQIVGIGDFNGDRHDDILWRNLDGSLSNWLGRNDGSFAVNDAAAAAHASRDWRLAGVGDFNGDGRDDILWRNDDGRLSNWLARADGGFSANDGAALTTVARDWSVAAVGDYDGDRRDDILWRHSGGALSDWLGTASGGFITNDFNAFQQVDPAWHVQATSFLF